MKDKLELFNEWVFVMDDILEVFHKELPASVAAQLDYSVASLNVLEKLILAKYAGTSEIVAGSEKDWLDRAARYVGETFRKNLGGYWSIILDDTENIYYNIPVITGYKDKPTPYCPLTLLTTAADRRTGDFMSSILTRAIEKLKK